MEMNDLIRKGQEFNFGLEERLRIVDLVFAVSSSLYELCLVSLNRVPTSGPPVIYFFIIS